MFIHVILMNVEKGAMGVGSVCDITRCKRCGDGLGGHSKGQGVRRRFGRT